MFRRNGNIYRKVQVTFVGASLLILGAGGHGRVVADVARSTGAFDRVAFLDDAAEGALAPLSEYARFRSDFDVAAVGIGNNALRLELLLKLRAAGYKTPPLISPRAYVSPDAKVGDGTVIEPMAIVNREATLGIGVIVSVGAIVDHNATVGDGAHINAGAICKAGSHVPEKVKLDAGEVVRGY